jgi:signal transduction histidine kinase
MSGPARVLIADDEAEIRFLLCKTLEKTYQCETVADGLQAIEFIREHRPDAVITDLKMPGADGLAVLAAAHQIDPQMPVLLITGFGTLHTAVEALRLGAYDYIQKPFDDVRSVLTTLEHALEVTRLRKENQRILDDLRRANAFKRQVMGAVAHDFNNMLHTIMGHCDLARMRPQDGNVLERIADIRGAASRASSLTRDLVTYGQVDSEALKLECTTFDLKECAEGTVASTVRPEQQERVRLPERGLDVYADPGRTSQILANLIGNGLKYSPRGGPVRVDFKADKAGNLVEVSVRDEGLGIPAAALETLFTPFSRLEDEERKDIPGCGLGLAIVRYLVDAHGGRVWVESTEGAGSTFYFTLPASSSES